MKQTASEKASKVYTLADFQRWGRKGGKKRSEAKRLACIRNSVKPRKKAA